MQEFSRPRCVTLWRHGVTGKWLWMQVVLDILHNPFRRENSWIYKSEIFCSENKDKQNIFS